MVGRGDSIFNTSFKSSMESFMICNCDYEIYNDTIQVRNYDEFHSNNEIGVFLINPDKEGKIGYNDELQINNAKIEWKKFEQDRAVAGTSNVIHAKSEWNIKNVMVENKFEKSFELIFDPLKISIRLFYNAKSIDTKHDVLRGPFSTTIQDHPPDRSSAKKFCPRRVSQDDDCHW
jgi:hypothetical protein